MSDAQASIKDQKQGGCAPGTPDKSHYPPCRDACPVKTDVQSYVWLIGQGKYAEALDVIRSVNPIASVCSLICHHPCEQACRRCEVDQPVSIRHLKRFALEQGTAHRRSLRKAIPKTQGKSIGIIGSGPAGLTTADDLALLGYDVTIYEKNPDLGGMLSSAIPTYRLSREALKEDIDDVLAKGVEARTGFEVGRDATLSELKEKHDAVLIAVGLSLSRSIPIPGVDAPGVMLAIPFLFNANYNKSMELGEKVLVIGGGNVAIDVARTALRLGVKQVEMVCLENEEEMPAWEWEVEEGVDEGIKIHHRWGPKSVRLEGGKVKGLDVVKVVSVFDESGRFSPSYDESEKTFIEADSIIITIGQMSDNEFLKDGPVEQDERGFLKWDRATQMSTAPGIFVSGEVVTGPGSAIQAAATGHRAAEAIHLYLQGKDIASGLKEAEFEKIAALPSDVAEKVKRVSRNETELLDPATRCREFVQIEIGYDEMTALKEARRCRSCGGGAVVDPDKCMACLTCLRVCPYDAPVVTSTSEISPDRCQACGLCAPECPARAIKMYGYDIDGIRNDMGRIVGDANSKAGPVIVAFICSKHALASTNGLPGNIVTVHVHCASRVDILDILKAFECGADGVSLVMCDNETCSHPGVPARVGKRAVHAKEVMSPLGYGEECVNVIKAGSESDWRAALQEAASKVTAKGK